MKIFISSILLLLMLAAAPCSGAERRAEALASMAGIEVRLDACGQEYERLKHIGYGGQTLRADLGKLGERVAALVSELEEIGKTLEADPGLKVYGGMIARDLKDYEMIKSVSQGQGFAYLTRIDGLGPDAKSTARAELVLHDADTGKKIASYTRPGWNYNEKTGATVLIGNFKQGYSQPGNLRLELILTTQDGRVAVVPPVFLAVLDNSEALTIHLPPDMVEQELYGFDIGLPKGFTPPYRVTTRYEVLQGEVEEEVDDGYCGEIGFSGANGGPGDPHPLEPSLFDRHECKVLNNLGRPPHEIFWDRAGRFKVGFTVADANGRRAKGSRSVTVEAVRTAIEHANLMDTDGNPVDRVRAGQTVVMEVGLKAGSDQKGELFLRSSAYDMDTGDRLSGHDVRGPLLYSKLRFTDFHWFGAKNVKIEVRLEDEAGKLLDQASDTLAVTHERLEITGPATIMATTRVPFGFRVPAGFKRPYRWIDVKQHDKKMLGVWSINQENGGTQVAGEGGIMFGFAEGRPGSGRFTISLADANGRVATGTKGVRVTLNPRTEKGVFDDVFEIMGGMADGFVAAAETMGEPGGPLDAYINGSVNWEPGGGSFPILKEGPDDDDEDDWKSLGQGASGSYSNDSGNEDSCEAPAIRWFLSLCRNPPKCLNQDGASPRGEGTGCHLRGAKLSSEYHYGVLNNSVVYDIPKSAQVRWCDNSYMDSVSFWFFPNGNLAYINAANQTFDLTGETVDGDIVETCRRQWKQFLQGKQ